MAYSNQGGVKNYLGNQKMVKAPLHWQSAPDHPKTELAYITDAEKKLLIKKDLHKSLKGGVNRGPAGIMSLNGWGSRDESQNVSGAAASAAESGRHTSDTLAAGMSNQDVQDFRSAAIASGAGQNVNPGWFGPRNRVSRDELRAAKAFAPEAYRATRGSGIGALLRGALGFFGGLPGKVMSGIMTAGDWAGNQGRNLWSGAQDFVARDDEGNPLYPNWESFVNRNKVQPIASIPTNQEIIGERIGEYWREPSNVMSANLTTNVMPHDLTNTLGVNQNVPSNEELLNFQPYKDGGRIGYRDGDFVEKLSWASPAGAGFNLGKMMGEKFKDSDENVMMASADEGVPFMWEEFLDAVNNHGYKGTYDQFLDEIDRSPWDEAAAEDEGIARLL
jgi:hypothetical protein